jgi:DNA polymerase elongation subunit (family B)
MKLDIISWHSEDVDTRIDSIGTPVNIRPWRPPPMQEMDDQFDSDAESISEEEIIDSGDEEQEDEDEPVASSFQYVVFLFCRNQLNGETVCLRIMNVFPEIYISFPNPSLQDYFKWTNALGQVLNTRTKSGIWVNCSNHIITGTNWMENVITKKTLWGFTNGESRTFLRFKFKSFWAWKRAGNALTYKREKFEKMFKDYWIFESQSDPMLSLCHDNNIQMGGSIEVDDEAMIIHSRKDTTCKSEWIIKNPKVLKPLNEPRITSNFVQLAFDIETYSHDGSFPSPKDIRNVIFQIGLTVKRGVVRDSVITKHIINLGPCAEIDDVELIVVHTENELLIQFANFIQRIDPDFIWGFNSDKFDWKYVMKRAKLLGVTSNDSWSNFQLSRFKSYRCYLVSENFSNRSHGDNRFHRVDIPGRLNLDLLLHVLQSSTYSSYKLDSIAFHILGERKHDVKAKQIFEYYASKDADLVALVAKYCVQDTLLVQRLVDRLECFTALMEMSSVMFVPVTWLLTKGQSVRVASLVRRKADQRGFLVPDIRTSNTEEKQSFQGATVLDPEVGMYDSPVVVLDFASLYPTIQMAYTICWSTIVLDERYSNCEGVDYKEIEWTDEETGQHHCYRFAQTVDSKTEVLSVLPELQQELFATRKAIKKQLKACEPGSEHATVLSLREKAVKISANSCYGFTSAFRLPLQQLGSSTTAWGRSMIQRTKAFMENEFPLELGEPVGRFKVVAGDSVAEWTPIIIRENGCVNVVTMKMIADVCKTWIKTDDGKEIADVTSLNIETWTEEGWTKVKVIIRHYTYKQMIRVFCPDGIVDVTNDHSLILSNGEAVKPSQVKPGQALLSNFPSDWDLNGDFGTSDEHFLLAKRMAEDLVKFPQMGPVPSQIMSSTKQMRDYFIDIIGSLTRQSITVLFQWETMIWYTLLKSMGYHVEMWYNPKESNSSIFRLHWFTKDVTPLDNGQTLIRHLIPLPRRNYMVYDLTTDNHHFHAGIGSLIVHNTDSVFVHMKDTTVERATELAQIAETRLTDFIFARKPIAIEFEKTYLPLVVEKKKRYFGLIRTSSEQPPIDQIQSVNMEKNSLVLGLKDDTKHILGTIDYKGLAIKRRNYCQLVKILYTKLICNVLGFGKWGLDCVKQDIRTVILDLLYHRVEIDDLIVTYKLKANYSNDNMPHVQLAKKLRKRDPGSAPGVGDRFGLVILVPKKGEALSMRSEDPDYVKEHKLKLDSLYYLQHLKRPMMAITEALGNRIQCQALFDAGEILANRQILANTSIINVTLDEELDTISRRLEHSISHKNVKDEPNKRQLNPKGEAVKKPTQVKPKKKVSSKTQTTLHSFFK